MTLAPGTCINLYSGDPTQSAGWQLSNVTLSAVANSGTPTGYAWQVEVSSTGSIDLQNYDAGNVVTDYPSTRYTVTAWVKQQTFTGNISLWLTTYNGNSSGAINGVNLQIPLANPSSATAQIVTDDNTSQPWTSLQFSIVALPNGWFECSVSGISPSDLTNVDLSASINTLDASSQWLPATSGQSFLLGGLCVFYDMGPTPAPPFVLTTNTTASALTYPNFDFPYTGFSESYPQNSKAMRLGTSYVFMAPPIAPPQRKFTLSFQGFGWNFTPTGAVDVTTGIGALREFYKAVQLYGGFTFQHPIDGQLIVRFGRPLDLPAVMKGAPFNTVKEFQVELLEVISSAPAAVAPAPLNLTMGGGNAPSPYSGNSWQVEPSTDVPPPFPGAQVFKTTCIAVEGDSNCFATALVLSSAVGQEVSLSSMVWVPSAQASALAPVGFRGDYFETTLSAPPADITLTNQWQLITYTGLTGAGNSSSSYPYPSIIAAGYPNAQPGNYFYVSAPMANLGATPQPFVGGPYPLFDFPYHSFAEKYPVTGLAVESPDGYQFTTPPQGPPTRTFTLSFDGMGWLLNPATGTYDSTYEPHWNIAALRAFYQQVQLYGIFYYPHPVDGMVTVRFAKPLNIPVVHPGAPFNTVKTFQVELIEVF